MGNGNLGGAGTESDELTASAASLLKLGRLEEAEAQAAKALATGGGSFQVHRTLGMIARAAKRPQDALRHFEDARHFAPLDAWNLFEIGQEHRGLQDYDAAVAAYSAALEVKPDFVEARRQIGFIARARDDHPTALAQFVAVRDLAPQNAWFHLDVATELRILGRLEEAEAASHEALALQPELAAAHRALGQIARARKDHLEAIARFEKARQYGPPDPWNVFDIANEYRTLERYDEAIAQYHAVLALKPDFAEAPRQIGFIERMRKDHPAALAQFVAARDLSPRNAWYHLDVAAELRVLSRLDEAEASCLEALALEPGMVVAHRMRGGIARDRKDHLGAIACLEKARQYAPSDPWIPFDIANEYRVLERHDEAIALYEAVLVVKPDFAEAHRQIGFIERGRKDHPAALARFVAARDLSPLNGWFHLDVAAELRFLGRLDEAEASCRAALALQPEFAAAHRMLGQIARDRKDHPAAVACFEKARQYGPPDPWILFDIANEYRALERHDDAIASYYSVLALKPDFAEAHRLIGFIERMRGHEAAAAGHFEVALFHLDIAATGSNPRSVLGAVEILLLLDRLEEAEARLIELENSTTDPDILAETHILRATIASKRRDFASEVLHRRQLAQLRPNNVWAWQVLVERQIALGLLDQALADVAEALTYLPDEPDLLIERARALRIAGRADEAALQLGNIALGERTAASTYSRLSNEYRSAGRYDEARSAAEAGIRVAPHHSPAHLSLAFAILEQEGPEAGLAQFRRELERSPANQEAAFQVSRLLREGGDAAGARDFLIGRGEDIRSPFRIFDELIVCLCHCEEFERARELVARRERLALSGDDLLGPAIEIELCSGDTKRLSALVSKAQDSPRPNSGVLSRIIRAAHVLGDLEAVIRTNRAWIAQDPARTLHGEIAIADAEFRLGRQGQAMAMLDSLQERFGDVADIYASRARLLRTSGKLRDAATWLRNGLRKFPQHVLLLEQYVRLCIQTNQIRTAQHLLASIEDESYFLSAERDLLDIEISLELRDLEGSVQKLKHFHPRYLHHRAQHGELSVRAYLGTLDLASARRHLASDIANSRFDRKLRRQSLNVSQSLLGQLLDEYRLDPDIPDLVAINRLPQGDRTGRFFEQVRRSPDSTASAITTLIHLRHTGFFRLPVEAGLSGIPRRIAQFWDSSDVPPDVAGYMESWGANNAGWDYQLFDEGRAADFIRSTCPTEVFTAYRQTRDATMKADLFRLAWLSHQGGFYVDADDVSTGPIQDILTPEATLVAHQEDLGSIGNNFVGAVAGHPVITAALAEATDATLRGDSDMVWLSTGPGMLSRAFMRWLVANAGSRRACPEEVIILDRGELTRVCAPHCQAAYKLTPLHWSKGLFG